MPGTQVQNGPITQPLLTPSQPPPQPPRKPWLAIALAGGALVVALAALAVILITNNSKSTRIAVVVNPNTVYQQKLSSTLTPVMAANRTLSASLQALDGSKASIRVTKTATTNAQQALIAARGAVAVVTVPQASTTLSQQATQALTQENGYLQAVKTTLGDPTGNTTASIQPLASATSSAFVPLASVAPGGSVSIYGVDNLLSWAQGATAAAKRNQPAPVVNNTTVVNPTVAVSPSGTQSAPDGGTGSRSVNDTIGRPTITADSNVSDGFARNILIAAAEYYQSNGFLPDGVTLSVTSPATGSTYNVSYSNDGSTVFATNLDGSTSTGNDVSFPASDANGTG